MKNETILKLINENKIEELKQRIIEEISISKNPNKSITKSIIELSKKAEKEQKNRRPQFAGAFIDNEGKQTICTSAYCVRYYDITEGTINTTNDSFDFNTIKPKKIIDSEGFNIDLNTIKNTLKIAKSTKTNIYNLVRFKNVYFDPKYIIDILNTFINPICWTIGYMLYISAENGEGILLACKPHIEVEPIFEIN